MDALEHEGQTYMAFFPAVEDEADEESEDYGLVILKSVTENGEELLSTLDSDEELNRVYDSCCPTRNKIPDCFCENPLLFSHRVCYNRVVAGRRWSRRDVTGLFYPHILL